MRTVVLLLVALSLVSSCVSRHASEPARAASGALAARTDRGALVGLDLLETRDAPALQAIAAEFPGDIEVETGAHLYRLRYWTEFKGRPVIASGLLSVPVSEGPLKGVVLYAHGTTMTRALSPSRPDRADGDQETAVFAGNRYLVVLPDYLGLGDSMLPQAYSIVRPQVDASIDMLRAVRTWAARENRGWTPSLLLMGFSQGGQTVAGLHRALERRPLDGYRLRGTVAIAGPHDLRGLSVRKTSAPDALELANVGYLAFAVSAYADYYGVPLDTAMTPAYARRAVDVFDGEKSIEQIISQLPSDARALFQAEFLRELQGNEDNWFTHALDDNETYAWVPRAPIRIVYGVADTDVPAASSRALYEYAKPRGGAVTLHGMGATDHMATAAQSYAPSLTWFDAITSTEE